jgi:hypothetical protein
VTVADALPAGFILLSATPSQGSYAAGVWTVGTVNPSKPQTLSLAVLVESPIPQTNTTAISHSDQFDPNIANNSATVTLTPSFAPVTVVSLERFGFHAQPTLLVVGFSGPLDAASAQDLSNYSLTLFTRGGRLRHAIRLVKATYDAATETVSLQPKERLPLQFHYSLTINASTPTGVRDTSVRLLDGAGTGMPGTNFVRVFGSDILAGKHPQFVRHAAVFSQGRKPGRSQTLRR